VILIVISVRLVLLWRQRRTVDLRARRRDPNRHFDDGL